MADATADRPIEAPPRSHVDCGPGCLRCALLNAMAARRGAQGPTSVDGVRAETNIVTPEDLLRDIDQLCNFLGDLIANVPNEDDFRKTCMLASAWLSDRVKQSRRRNLTHPLWRAQHEQANGAGGRA